MVVTMGQQYDVGENPTVILCSTFILITMQNHQTKQKTLL